MLYIGIDLGTSAVKLLLMDEKGNIQKIVSKEYICTYIHMYFLIRGGLNRIRKIGIRKQLPD